MEEKILVIEKVTESLDRLTMHKSEDVLVGALDFGTTFSGFAFAFSQANPAKINCVREWPGLEGYAQEKVETLISYDPGEKGSFTWGAQRHRHSVLAGVKLLLDPEAERPLYIPPGGNSAAELRRLGKTPVDVAADYMREIHKHAMDKIQSSVPKEFFDICEKRYVVSVPALWSDKAKEATLRAARLAGMSPVTLITEPEAAALHTIHMLKDQGISIGDVIIILDAGGGTVDLISYEVAAVAPNLALKELVSPKGGMSGSLVLNKRFEAKIQEMIGDDAFMELKRKPGWISAVQEFDRIHKKAYLGDDDEDFFVNFPMAQLPDDPENNILDSCWHMKGRDMRQLFAPLITEISRLVDEQINLISIKRAGHPQGDKIKAIFLVGGFGSNAYLKKRLVELHPEIQIIQPDDAWSAIVRGACLSLLPREPVVKSSVATRHYGVSALEVYNPEEDVGQEKILNEFTGNYKVDKMTWYIRRGDELIRDQKLTFPFYKELPYHLPPEKLIFRVTLICSDSADPPRHPKEGVTRPYVILDVDMRTLSAESFWKKYTRNGTPFYKVHYSLCLTTVSAGFTFALEVNGETKGACNHRFE